MLTPAEAAWLACAIDSEGTIVLQKYRQRGSSLRIVAHVAITNTDTRYIDYAESLMRRVSGGCHRGVRSSRGERRPALYVAVDNMTRVEPLLRTTLPFLIVKKHRAETLLAYFGARHAARAAWRGRGSPPYGEELGTLLSDFYSDDGVVNPKRRELEWEHAEPSV